MPLFCSADRIPHIGGIVKQKPPILWLLVALALSKPYEKIRLLVQFRALLCLETAFLPLLHAVLSCPSHSLNMQL